MSDVQGPVERHFGPVWFIPGGNRGRYPYSNSVYVEGPGILIDAGADSERILSLREGPGIREVWLSHWHEDHLKGLDLLEGVPIRQMACEAAPLSDIETFMDWYGFSPSYRDYWRRELAEAFGYRPRKAHRYFTPGEVIDLGSCTVEVVPTPGHTPGHLAFHFREPSVLFMGDYDLTRFGPWYGDRDSDLEALIESTERLRRIQARTRLASHEDGVFEGGVDEIFDRYLAVIDEREGKLLDFLAEPRTMEEIVARCIVYRKPREPKEFFEFGERAIMGKHLERLRARGTVEYRDDRYRRLA